ncbi:hypothetical protein [Streptomyces marispadix]|uniref:C2H2-type domain-containing protein n=1 Tax=Streptomyces marispadix TaxID=2922868 RepID=A0ABS9T667_9ACTN|nr:hypothetical protein [Streptomyces marispadix]MCH6163928.1 hypothetical protein [Streptomyces marispadix]
MSLSPTHAFADDRGRQGNPDHDGDPAAAVFVDSTGRRALLLRRAGMVFAAAVLVYAGMVGVAFVGGPSLAPAQLSPFGNAGSASEPGGDGARPAGSSSERQSAKPCRKHCGKKCRNRPGDRNHQGHRKHPGKQCARKPFQKTLDSPSGAPLSRSARSSAEGR